MNIINLINASPSELNNQSFSLDEMLKKHPYFSIGQMIKAKIAYQTNHLKFQETLGQAAIYSPNRTALFQFIYQEEFFKVSKPIEIVESKVDVKIEKEEKEEKEIPALAIVETRAEIEVSEKKDELIVETLPENQEIIEVEIEKSEEVTAEIVAAENTNPEQTIEELKPKRKSAAKKVVVEKPAEDEKSIEIEAKTKAEPKKPKSKDKTEIIDIFIKVNPSVSRPTDQDYSQTVEMANKSLEENFDFVSETLADIYLQQGNK